MTSTSRRYYEMELGAGMGPSPGFNEAFGYTEPLRRFIQREGFEPQANEIPNTMPSWMPGDDYCTNFRVGDSYIKVDQGFARLPGAGYEALHPELKDLNPEDYPDINKMAILADVAPYSREYNAYRLKVGKQAKGNTELEIEYEKILDRVRQTWAFSLLPCFVTFENRYRLHPVLSIYLSLYESLAVPMLPVAISRFCAILGRPAKRIEKPRHKLRHRAPAPLRSLSKLRHPVMAPAWKLSLVFLPVMAVVFAFTRPASLGPYVDLRRRSQSGVLLP